MKNLFRGLAMGLCFPIILVSVAVACAALVIGLGTGAFLTWVCE